MQKLPINVEQEGNVCIMRGWEQVKLGISPISTRPNDHLG